MAGYSGTPLLKKLGVKTGMVCCVMNAPENYEDLTGLFPEDCKMLKSPAAGKLDFIHFFAVSYTALTKNYDKLKAGLKPNGMLWVSWPKKSSGVATDITEDLIRQHALVNGLVDVKVCAVDETWSGLKLVYRLKDRK